MQIYQSPYYSLTRLSDAVLLLERSARDFASAHDLIQEHVALLENCQEILPLNTCIVDLRKVRGRNDATFENAMIKYRRLLSTLPKRTLVVVETAMGCMQVVRYGKKDKAEVEAFNDLESAKAAAGL